ncbi:hypothetical protein [Massilia sp. GCM10023247]|uniref:hypothetical protein n=1 Tax=Massilia sp. GCM10023247 TaxID=3252643 RepID=UPI00361EE054
MKTLSESEIECVSGCGLLDSLAEKHKIEAGGALALAGAIGYTSFGGAAWGATAVGVAFAAAPISVIAIGVLAGVAGYRFLRG